MNILKKYDHWLLPGELTKLLRMISSSALLSQYSIDQVRIVKNAFIVTDGRRMLRIKTEHSIPEGCYYLTEEGFLLGPTEGKFPEYKEIVATAKQRYKLVEIGPCGPSNMAVILGMLIEVKVAFDLELLYPVLEALHLYNIEVFVRKEKTSEGPFEIHGQSLLGDVLYIQMPVQRDWKEDGER